ncbi:MAG: hypothetical protein Q7S95_02125 [bacterium]|nr:hypothetical protein [bacterium]
MSATTLQRLSLFFEKNPSYRTRGFLPAEDPLWTFPAGSPLAALDEWGARLPRLLGDPGFRGHMREDFWPGHWFKYCTGPEYLPELRLYYVRLAFMASAYVHQLGQEQVKVLPHNIAVPLVEITRLLGRPPILSYDGYALYNWRRINPEGPITPNNLMTIQNFMHLPDAVGVNQETWFIDTHVAIEAIAARILDALAYFARGEADLNGMLYHIANTIHWMRADLACIPEHMDPMVYYKTFRNYIQGFKDVVYEGVSDEPRTLCGETGAQSSIVPLLDSFLKIHHERSPLVRMLEDMRNYMPAEHRVLLALVDALPDIRPQASKDAWNDAIDALIGFRRLHLGWAEAYIHKHVADPHGTGGTVYMQWLGDLIKETEAAKK